MAKTRPTKPPETHPCTSCGSPVAARRPSSTGTHWCQATLCQRERTKFYKKQRVKAAVDHEKRALVEMEHRWNSAVQIAVLALTSERITCSTCSVDDAIDTLPHPNLEKSRCLGTANPVGAALLMPLGLAQAIWPRIAS